MFVILVVGDKDWCDIDELERRMLEVSKDQQRVMVVHGGRDGLDRLVEKIAFLHRWQMRSFTCDWTQTDKKIVARNRKTVFDLKPNVAIVCRVADRRYTATEAVHKVVKAFAQTVFTPLKRVVVLSTNKVEEADNTWIDESTCP